MSDPSRENFLREQAKIFTRNLQYGVTRFEHFGMYMSAYMITEFYGNYDKLIECRHELSQYTTEMEDIPDKITQTYASLVETFGR